MGFLSEFLMKNGKNLFFLLWLHMGMNLFVWRIEHGKFEKRIFEKAVNSFFFLFFINVLLFLFPYLPYIYGSILAVICFVEILFYLEYQSLFTSNTFLVLQETNVEESKEFLKEIFSFRFFRNCFLLFVIIFLIPYSFLLGIREWNFYTLKYLWDIIFIASCIIFLQAQFPRKRKRYYSYLPLLRILKAYLNARKQGKENKQSLEKQKKIEVFIKRKENRADTLIFVIGESASRNYLEIYGSYFKNTPYTCRREKEGSLVAFNDVISSESLTAISIPNMLTFKNYEKEKEWYDCANLISILKKAGYRTYWFSVQSKNETVGKVFSSLSDQAFFAENLQTSEPIFDEILLEKAFPSIGQEKKKAIFVHLSGSHNSYIKRYPGKWAIDSVNNVFSGGGERKKKKIYCRIQQFFKIHRLYFGSYIFLF